MSNNETHHLPLSKLENNVLSATWRDFHIRRVKYEDLNNLINTLINFMYCGEITINEEDFKKCLTLAEDFKIKGLHDDGRNNFIQTTKIRLNGEEPSPKRKCLKDLRYGALKPDKDLRNEALKPDMLKNNSLSQKDRNNLNQSFQTKLKEIIKCEENHFPKCFESDTNKDLDNKKDHQRKSGTNNEPDLLGSILSGMKSPQTETSKWEGQPNQWEFEGKTQETKWEERLVHVELQNQSIEPLQQETSSSSMMSKSSKSDNKQVKFTKKRSGISEKNQVKTSERPNGRGSMIREAHDNDKRFEMNRKKFPKEMEGTKSFRSKSSWKGERKLGSTRTAWRPDRAYDFGRNYMEINDVETPNDDFELARIV